VWLSDQADPRHSRSLDSFAKDTQGYFYGGAYSEEEVQAAIAWLAHQGIVEATARLDSGMVTQVRMADHSPGRAALAPVGDARMDQGHNPKKSMWKRPWVWIAGVVIVLVAASFAAQDKQPNDEEVSPTSTDQSSVALSDAAPPDTIGLPLDGAMAALNEAGWQNSIIGTEDDLGLGRSVWERQNWEVVGQAVDGERITLRIRKFNEDDKLSGSKDAPW